MNEFMIFAILCIYLGMHNKFTNSPYLAIFMVTRPINSTYIIKISYAIELFKNFTIEDKSNFPT